MRIIHTADWHLCNRLGRIDRTADLRARVERVAEICLEKQADLLVIAGDLFSESADLEQLSDAFKHIHKSFSEFFRRGGTILAITGNHDRDGKINMVRSGMFMAHPFAGQTGELETGRMYLINGRALCTVPGADGQRVQFVLLPYPFPSRYDLSKEEYRTKEELHRLLHSRIVSWMQDLPGKPQFQANLPSVVLAHLHVRGSELHTTYQMNEADDVQFAFADLNPNWAYIALGHIHKPQRVCNQENVRYCGSLDRLDFGDTHDEHGVLLVDVGPSGLLSDPEHVPIPATPFLTVRLHDLEVELPDLADKYPNRETAIVRVLISPNATSMSRDEASRKLRKIFPRLHEVKWLESEAKESEETRPRLDIRASLESTVREYMRQHEQLKADPDREEILALLETFLNKGVS